MYRTTINLNQRFLIEESADFHRLRRALKRHARELNAIEVNCPQTGKGFIGAYETPDHIEMILYHLPEAENYHSTLTLSGEDRKSLDLFVELFFTSLKNGSA